MTGKDEVKVKEQAPVPQLEGVGCRTRAEKAGIKHIVSTDHRYGVC